MRKRLLAIQVLLLLAIALLYRAFGAALIETMYKGASLPFLNSLIQGQSETPVLFYIFKADKFFLKVFLIFVLTILPITVIFALFGGKKTKAKPAPASVKISLILAGLLLIPSFYLLRYRHVLHKLSNYDVITAPSHREKQFPGLGKKEILMLGNAHTKLNHPRNSYLEYAREKKQDTVRIGLFGCSFVEGTETAKGHDIASFLQEKFDKAGFKNVEVINFGVAGYGVHQMYLLWEFVGKGYGLDYVIFMPFSWHVSRDSTFILAGYSYGPVHARYVIKDGKFELVPVSGNTRPEACKIYYKITPPWRYIRYDYRIPMFLKVLLPSRLHERPNPFYYKPWKFRKREILTTYKMLFEKLSGRADNVIVVANDDEIYNLRDNAQRPNIYFIKSGVFRFFNFLHFALGHNSALGNQLRADEIFSLLTGKDKPALDIITLYRNGEGSKRNAVTLPRPLCEYDDISVNIGNCPVATFLEKRDHSSERLNFRRQKIAALLLMPSLERVKFAKFAPLRFLLKDKKPVFLSFKKNGNLFKIPIGAISAPTAVLGKWSLKLDENGFFSKHGAGWFLEIKNGNFFLQTNTRLKDICITSDGKKILKATPFYKNGTFTFLSKHILGKAHFSFKPAERHFACLRAKTEQFVDKLGLKEKEGTVDLVLTEEAGRGKRYPLFRYKIIIRETSPCAEVYPKPISAKR